MANPRDHMLNEQIEANKQFLNDLAEQIKQTPTYGSEIAARRWLETNREKILRNKQLIDLIG